MPEYCLVLTFRSLTSVFTHYSSGNMNVTRVILPYIRISIIFWENITMIFIKLLSLVDKANSISSFTQSSGCSFFIW